MKLTNDELRLWVLNDEGLWLDYERWSRRNTGGIRGYIRENRDFLIAAVKPVIDGERPAHRLIYGG